VTRVPESQFAHLSSKTGEPAKTRRVVRISFVSRKDQERSIERTRALLHNMNVAR
jgi:hypothetical protein